VYESVVVVGAGTVNVAVHCRSVELNMYFGELRDFSFLLIGSCGTT
jgi:hypothetical protein